LHTKLFVAEMEGAVLCERWNWLWINYSWILLYLFLLQWWLYQWILLWSQQQVRLSSQFFNLNLNKLV